MRSRWLPWVIFGLSCLLLAMALVIGVSHDMTGIATTVFVVGNGAVGAFIASKLRSHPVGWLLLATAACFALGGLLVTYVEQSVTRSLPVGPVVVHAANWSFGLGVSIAATLVFLYFPSGRLPSPRWRPLTWVSITGAAMLLVGVALSPDSFEGLPVQNPWALPSEDPLLLLFEGGGLALLLSAMFGALASLVVRFRVGSETERRQLKWVLFAVTVAAVGIVGTYMVELVNGPAELSDDAENTVVTLGLALVPISIGLAIFRYRLYEIEKIISRTVTYGLVVGLLGALIFGMVTGLAVFLPSGDPLLVAMVTLVAFGLFNPLRRRVQVLVDRRFNRSRYDAERVIEEFSGALRHRVDADQLVQGWMGIVALTMEPVAVGVWVRE